MRAAIADLPAQVRSADVWPDVDVIMPIRNEADDLRTAIDTVLAQEYPGTMSVVLAVGPSDDGTEALARSIAAADDRVLVVDNPVGITPAALNAAKKSSG